MLAQTMGRNVILPDQESMVNGIGIAYKEDVKSFFVVVGALVSFTTIFVWHFTLSRCSLCKIQWRKLHHQICRKPPQFSWKFS